MAKVSYIQIPPGLDELYRKGLQPGDRFTFSRIRVKDIFLSRTRVKNISRRSQFSILSPVWASFSTTEKQAWSDVGVLNRLSGWSMFLVDTTERRKAGFSGYATPNQYHQSEVGRIFIESPSTGLTIQQAHPSSYYVLKKVKGTRSQYSPVLITEILSLPLSIGISFKTDLTAVNSDWRARFFCVIYSSYQGLTIETPVEIPFGLSDDWNRQTASISGVLGPVRGYSAFIELYNVRGNLYFDNVDISHSGENWARDPFCNNISLAFTRAFFQVAKHWIATNPNEGADFGSVYNS